VIGKYEMKNNETRWRCCKNGMHGRAEQSEKDIIRDMAGWNA
jgi:hypothetical protein